MLMLEWIRIHPKLSAVKIYKAIQKVIDHLYVNKWDRKLDEGEKIFSQAFSLIMPQSFPERKNIPKSISNKFVRNTLLLYLK